MQSSGQSIWVGWGITGEHSEMNCFGRIGAAVCHALQRSTWVVRRIQQQVRELRNRITAPRRDAVSVLRTVQQFVRDSVPAILKLDPGTTIRTEVPARGRDGLVLILHAGERRAVLRAYTRRKHRKAEAHIRASRLLLREGIVVPAIYFSTMDSPVKGVVFVLEQFVDGESRAAGKLTTENIRAIARQLARMHSILNPHWGTLEAERVDSYFRILRGRIIRDLSVLEKHKLLSPDERQKAEKWLLGFKDRIDAAFSLTQKDLHPGNSLFSHESGQHHFIDVGRLQWKPAAEEVFRAYSKLLRNDEEKRLVFNEAYFAGLPRDVAARTQDLLPFYTALQIVSGAAAIRNAGLKKPDYEPLQRLRTLATL